MNKKKSDTGWGCIIIVGIFVLLGVFMPKSGNLALVDVAIDIVGYWGIIIYLFLKLKKYKNELQKELRIRCLIGIACLIGICAGIWNTKNLMMDLFLGPQEVVLHDIEVSEITGTKGIISQHYYLKGYDADGNKHKMEISANEYWNTDMTEEIVVIYYKNTKRVYAIGGIR